MIMEEDGELNQYYLNDCNYLINFAFTEINKNYHFKENISYFNLLKNIIINLIEIGFKGFKE